MITEDVAATEISVIPVTNSQAEAIKAAADFGTTIVKQAAPLGGYIAKILGTVPEDAVGLVIGDPLHAVRTVIAAILDDKVEDILGRRRAKRQPVSPSLAVPLVRAAYDESRPELQQFWAELIAAAMDPSRAPRVRVRFVETVRQMDPLDALLLKERHRTPGGVDPDAIQYFSGKLGHGVDEITISIENLERLGCVVWVRANAKKEFHLTAYGRELLLVCQN